MAKDNTKIGFEKQIWDAACVLCASRCRGRAGPRRPRQV